jgi:hypothetical protein
MRIIAHREARQRVKENLGYDPVERARRQLAPKKGGSGNDGGDGRRKASSTGDTRGTPTSCHTRLSIISQSHREVAFWVHYATPVEYCKGPNSSSARVASSSNHHGCY